MSRTFWFAAGAASGVYALLKARRTAQHFTPDGVAARVASLRTGARLFAADVSTGMAEREDDQGGCTAPSDRPTIDAPVVPASCQRSERPG